MYKTVKFNTEYNGYCDCQGLWGCTPILSNIVEKLDNNDTQEKNICKRYLIDKDLVRKALINLCLITIEITTKCNLKCKYCIHGVLYKVNGDSAPKHLNTDRIISLIDYLVAFWKEQDSNLTKSTNIGFHGGEPLVNFELIRNVVEYVKLIDTNVRRFTFSMFTNGVLLEKYIDYLVENNIYITVSLDGNSYNNSYRVYANGKASFDKVTNNIDMIKKSYPDYFCNYVRFTSVLHDRNSPHVISEFFKTRYGKLPRINELESFDINEEKRKEFQKLYSKNKINNSLLVDELDDKAARKYFINKSNNVFDSYNDLLYKTNKPVYLTQTCQPFGKKLFLSANSEIAFCQTIYKKHTVGNVSDTRVYLDLQKIADDYNDLIKKMLAECYECYMPEECSQCMLKLVDNDHQQPICPNQVKKELYSKYLSQVWGHLESHPETYIDFINMHNPK